MSNYPYTYTSPHEEARAEEKAAKAKYDNMVFLFFIVVCLGISLIFGTFN